MVTRPGVALFHGRYSSIPACAKVVAQLRINAMYGTCFSVFAKCSRRLMEHRCGSLIKRLLRGRQRRGIYWRQLSGRFSYNLWPRFT